MRCSGVLGTPWPPGSRSAETTKTGAASEAGGGRVEVAPHRYSLRVAPRGQVGGVAEIRCEVPATEEARHDARIARAVDLPPLHRGKQRGTGVLFGKEHRQTARVEIRTVGKDGDAEARTHGARRVPFELVFVDVPGRGQVGIRRADQAELEGVCTETRLLNEPLAEGFAHIAQRGKQGPAEHELHVLHARVSQRLEIAELVLRAGSALRIPLVLGHLDEGLETRAAARIFRRNRPAVPSRRSSTCGRCSHSSCAESR